MEATPNAEIISLARKIIVQQGVRALRMDEIARSVHVSKRTLYETFGDKEELIFLAVREHFNIFESANMKVAQGAPNILIAILVINEEVRKNADINWNIRSSLRRYYPKINERIWNDNADEKRKVIVSSIKMGIKQGYIDSRINIDLTLNMFTYIAMGISENNDMMKIPKEIAVNDAFMEVLINYIRGISTVKGVQIIDEYLATIKK